MPFAALELKENEIPHQAVGCLMRAAVEQGRRFATLEVMNSLFIGRIRFMVFRTDSKDLEPILRSLQDRAFIHPQDGQYICLFPGGATGTIPAVSMQSVGPSSQRRVYRGPRVKFWERQFL